MHPISPEQLRLGRLFHRAHVCVRKAVDPTIKSLHLNLRDIWIMNVAMENHPSTQSEMSKVLDLNENVIVRMVNHLEELGYVVRQPGEDARTREIKMTSKGHDAYQKAHRLMDPAYSKLLSHLSGAEQTMLVRLLRKFLDS